MTGPTCTRRIEFDAGHRLQRHESKCRNVHGHRYVVDITCEATRLDDVGRVIDFAEIKRIVGGWIDDNLDHGFIIETGDPFLQGLTEVDTKVYTVPFSPTAENLVVFLADQAQALLRPAGIKVAHVRLYETPNGWADWSAP